RVEHLLELYVNAQEADLRRDMAKYGDVRAEPGFDPDKRQAELDRLRRLEFDREAQIEDAPKMRALMDEMEQLIAKNPKIKPGKLANERREFLALHRKYDGRPETELSTDMVKCAQESKRFQEKHQSIFRPQPIGDAALLK